MRKYVSILSLSLILGFLVFNISHNPLDTVPPLTALPPGGCVVFPSPPHCHPPSVTTDSASSLTTTGATLNGEMTAINGAGHGSVGERGFQYGLTEDYGSLIKETDPDSLFDVGDFSQNISSLTCNTTYHYIAYAVNNKGTGFGEDATFTTSSCPHFSTGRKTAPSSASSSSSSSGSSTASSSSSAEPSAVTPPTVPTVTVCPAGDKFSTATGLPCTSFEAQPTPPVAPSVVSAPITSTLVFGSTGEEVKTLQAELNKNGFKSGPEDGIFGPITKGAVIRFQLAHGLKGDGIFGVNSRTAWNAR